MAKKEWQIPCLHGEYSIFKKTTTKNKKNPVFLVKKTKKNSKKYSLFKFYIFFKHFFLSCLPFVPKWLITILISYFYAFLLVISNNSLIQPKLNCPDVVLSLYKQPNISFRLQQQTPNMLSNTLSLIISVMCSLTMFSHQKLCTFHSCVQTLETLYFRSGKKTASPT